MHRALGLLIAMAMAAQVGCIGEDARGLDEGESAAGPVEEIQQYHMNGSLTLEVASAGVSGTIGEEVSLSVPVDVNTVFVVAEARWSPQEQDLDLHVRTHRFCASGDYDQDFACRMLFYGTGESDGAFTDSEGLPLQDNGYARVDVPVDAGVACAHQCEWGVDVLPEKAAGAVVFEVVVTTFEGVPPEEGFTAFSD